MGMLACGKVRDMRNCKVQRLIVGDYQENCYLVQNNETKELFIVDPGADAYRISMVLERLGGVLRGILLTHGHHDHIGAVEALRSQGDIPVYALKEEEGLLLDPTENLSGMHFDSLSIHTDRLLNDKEVFDLAGIQVQVIATPGHTAGSCCYYLEKEKILFSGDTLFQGSIGRSDLPTGDEETLIRSIKKKLMTLPDDTAVLPGHGGYSRIDLERMQNPFLL